MPWFPVPIRYPRVVFNSAPNLRRKRVEIENIQWMVHGYITTYSDHNPNLVNRRLFSRLDKGESESKIYVLTAHKQITRLNDQTIKFYIL